MSAAVRVIQVGLGGFGQQLLKHILSHPDLALVGAVDPRPEAAGAFLPELQGRGVDIVPDIAAVAVDADLAVISTPIGLHAEHACACVDRGWHVLCEKPVAGSQADAQRMIDAAQQTGKSIGIGFNWSPSPATQKLKAAIRAGRFGAPRRLDGLVLWPRDVHYFKRNNWVGRRMDAQGRPVHDSPVSNACSHFLHHMLYLLGPEMDRGASVQSLRSETYRAQDLETFDAAALEIDCGAATIGFWTAHSTQTHLDPVFRFQFEEAEVNYAWGAAGGFVARYADGRCEAFGDPQPDFMYKLSAAVAVCRGEAPQPCPVGACVPHLRIVEALSERAVVEADASARRMGKRGDADMHVIDGLDKLWISSYAAGRLPHDLGLVPWTRQARAGTL